MAGALLLGLCAAPIAGVLIAVPAAVALGAAVAAVRRPARTEWITAVAAAVSVAASALVHLRPPPEMHNVAGLCLASETAALVVLLVLLVRRGRLGTVAFVAPLAALAVIVLPLRVTAGAEPPASLLELVVLALVWAFPAGGAVAAGYYLRTLDERRAGAVAAARQAQRLEIARDLHDFVGHDLNGIVLEAQAAQLAPDQAAASLPRVERAGLSALRSMDHLVHLLRGEERDGHPKGIADLPALVGRFESPPVLLEVEPGLAERVPREVGAVAYRVVVESLTNVRRHAASAGQVWVTLNTGNGPALAVTVDDDGTEAGAPAGGTHGRLGLVGLTESVGLLDGMLEAGPLGPRGWRVRAVLPIRSAS